MKMKILINTRTSWDEPPRSRHQVAEALSKNSIVYFIEANKIGLPRITIKKISEHLFVVTPFFPIDYRIRFRLPIINELFQFWLSDKIYKINVNFVLINFDHTAHIINKKVRSKKIYYCSDDHIRTYGLPIPFLKKYFNKCEKKVASTSDICIATSNWLAHKLKAYNKNTYIIKLGAPNIQYDLEYLKKTKKIKIALVGFINHHRIPLKVIKEILDDNRMELHLFGKIDKKISLKFREYKNFINHGIKKGNKLFYEIEKVDVGIALYNKHDVNKGRTPNKLWIYLALGKPVVVTDIYSIRNWKFPTGYVYKSKNNIDFKNLIIKANTDDNEELFHDRISYAKLNTWECRMNELKKIIKDY